MNSTATLVNCKCGQEVALLKDDELPSGLNAIQLYEDSGKECMCHLLCDCHWKPLLTD